MNLKCSQCHGDILVTSFVSLPSTTEYMCLKCGSVRRDGEDENEVIIAMPIVYKSSHPRGTKGG